MMISVAQVFLSIGVVLLSGLVSYVVSDMNYRRFEKRKMKIETLKRLAAHRFVLTDPGQYQQTEEFFEALNEVFVVFQDAPKVLDALDTMQGNLSVSNRFLDDLIRLFKEMCDDLRIDRKRLNDSFFLTPFIPNKVDVSDESSESGSP